MLAVQPCMESIPISIIIRIKSNLDNVSAKSDIKKLHGKEVKREIMNLNSKKATCHGAILAKILK